MTKAVETILLQDIAAIKRALIESEYGAGLIKDHAETKARTYENKRAITRFRTIVYAITSAATFLGIAVAIVYNWSKLIN